MTNSREPLPDLPKISMSWGWILATALTSALIAVIMVTVYFPSVPDPMPVHWDAAGNPDRFEPKSLTSFLVTLLLSPVIMLLTMLLTEGFISMQSAHITGPGGAKTANEAYRTWWGYRLITRHLGWYLFALNLVILLGISASYVGESFRFGLLVMLLIIALLSVLLFWLIVREQRVIDRKYPPAKDAPQRAWGIFLHAPGDNRVLLDTGSGTNFTFNVATTGGKIGALVLIAMPIVLIVGIAIAALSS